MKKMEELFYEPIEIMNYLIKEENDYSSEMEERQLAFLCGLIKKHKPHKIVEIGVAAGGTTAVILNCIAMLELDTQVFSVDLATDFYADKNKKTGYLAKECKEILESRIEHILYTGKFAVEYLERIGGEIDFLILDTVHSIPGELLDFLAYFPFLKQGAVVVLHDVALNHYHNQPTQIATKVLLDTVVAEKWYALDDDGSLLNIGAFTITDNTGAYIDSVFSALMLTWTYRPRNEELALYRNLYSQFYSTDQIELFDLAVCMNQRTWEEAREAAKKAKDNKKKLKQNEFLEMYRWIEMIKSKEVYIYGCGYFGQLFHKLFDSCGIVCKGYIVSDGEKKNETENVYYLSEVNPDEEKQVVLIGVNSSLHSEICEKLLEKGIHEYIIPEKDVYNYLI